MSRIGNKPIELPAGVTVHVDGRSYTVKGPKGSVQWDGPEGVDVAVEDKLLVVRRRSDSKHHRASHGLVRSVLENHVLGVVKPYERILEIHGVGYQANIRGRRLGLKVGFSNEVMVDIPEGVQVETPSATRIVVRGSDKQSVGQFAANVRRVRPPEPYNGKGIRFEGERVQRKAGKSFSSAG